VGHAHLPYWLSLILAISLLSVPGFANKEPKTYPEEGKIVATGRSEWVVNSQHQHAHTYTVETDTKSYLLECGHKPVFGSMGEECGGSKKLQLGDVIHFRIEKDWVYIPINKSGDSAGEEKLRVMSAALKPSRRPTDPRPRQRRPKRNHRCQTKRPRCISAMNASGKPDTREI
jgi:hypothetical protein